MSISEPFVRRPIATSLLMGGIFLVGLVVFPLLPVAPLPQVDFPTISVSATLPGASPETMASSVATPLETQFAQISGLSQMTSTNALGSTSITLQFDLNRNIDAAAQDVQTGIDAAGGQLPKNLPSPPTYKKVNPADSPILLLSVHSDVLPVTTVDDYAENILAQQISQIPGVAQVSIGGQQKPAVRVQVDPTKLAALGLEMEDVANVIVAATVDAPKGSINGPTRSMTIYANDQLLKAAPWNDVVVAYKNGAAVRIRDIGVAVDGPENRLVTAWQNGRNGILLLIFKQPGANVIEAVDRVQALLPHALASVPPSIKVDTVANRTTTIKASVEDVERTLLITIVLVVLVIFLFLRNAWATIIPGVTVPLALLGTVAMMYVLNFSLDNLSLMALTIAVGFVVDDAIVMLENIYRHIEEGLTPLEATLKGAGEIGFTILSISISLVAVFIPLLLMGGIIGRLFREFAITMTMTIVVSAFVALTLSPTMCALFLRDEKHAKHGKAYMVIERGFDKLLAGYTRGLDFVLDHKRATLVTFLITLAATVMLYIEIPKGFFPQQDTGIISGLTDAPQDISFEEMVRRQHAVFDVVERDPDIASYGTGIGGNRPINTGFVILGLKPLSERKSSADEIITRLRPQLAKVPGIQLFLQASQDLNVGGRTSRTQYQYTVQDADINELNEWAPKLLEVLKKQPTLRDVASDQQTSSGMLTLEIDRDQASRFGIQPQAIDQALYDAFGQRQAAQFFTQANSYHVVLEITPSLQGDPDSLKKLYLKSPLTGQMVPLSAMTKFDTQHVTYLSINHQGQFPAVTLSFNLAPGAALGDAVDAINRASVDMHLPATITGNFQGTAQAFQSSLKSQPYLILAALVAVYIILGMLYESYIHPLTILSTLPSAGVGALLVLMLFHIELSVIALIGIILLIGIVKKNGIMMVDFALQAEREQHLSPHDSIRQACLMRFRPIMMTTMAALLGALPLALGHGTGSELRRPLGYTMVGGLILSQALTLFTTPVIYLYLDEFSMRMRGRRSKKRAEAALAAQSGTSALGEH
ncbi:MAG TPA: multidrug efflux RND transporter permease subunit [Steroidobacteraceae bacterium]|nr:multidrug efflux RND transporter permease subunit [Steroidobacteraceae bacterium]